MSSYRCTTISGASTWEIPSSSVVAFITIMDVTFYVLSGTAFVDWDDGRCGLTGLALALSIDSSSLVEPVKS